MRFGLNVITNFLWETYEIDRGTYLRKKILQASEKDKELLNKDHILDNLFLIRRTEDPGFFLHVTKKVQSNTDALEKAERYVKKLILNHCYDVESDVMGTLSSTRQSKLDIDECLTHSFDITNLSCEKMAETTLKYLNARNEIALEKGDEDEIVSIAHIISDYLTGKSHIHYLFSIQALYENLDSSREIIFQNKKYIVENIKNESMYDKIRELNEKTEKSFSQETFSMYTILNPKFAEKVIKIITGELDSERTLSMDEILKYFKFIGDFASIASLVWFEKLRDREKIEILNKNYNFSISQDLLLEYMSTGTRILNTEEVLSWLVSEALSFSNENNFEEAEIIWSFVESRTENVLLRYLCLSNIAAVSRNKMNYEKALEIYERSFELLSSVDRKSAKKSLKELKKYIPVDNINFLTYHQADCLMNIGEMYHQIGDTEKGEKYIQQAEQFKDVHAEDRILLYWNLACLHHRLFNFKIEYYYLNKVLDVRSNKFSELKDKGNKRLNELNNPDIILPDGSLDPHKLSIWDKRERQKTLYTKADNFYKAFQFEKCIEYLDYALSINDDKELYFSKAVAYISIGNLDAAKKAIQSFENGDNCISKVWYYSLMSIIQIHEGKIEEGIGKLEKAVRFSFTSTSLKMDNKTDENPSNWTTSYLLPLYAKYILPLKDQELTYRTFDRLEGTLYEFDIGASPSELIGTLLMNYGFLDEAKIYFEHGLNRTDNLEKYKADLYFRKGICLSIENNYKEALENLDKSFEISKRPVALEEKAEIYSNLSDFKNAIHCIKEAQKLDPKNSKYLKLEKEYSYLEKSVINIQKISDIDIRSMLHTAESIMLKLYKDIDAKTAYFDYSIASIEYGKALELMLHKNISHKIREIIITDDRPMIEEKYWNGRYGIRYKTTLRNILGIEEKSIGLGQWRYFLDEINSLKKRNPIALKVHDYITSSVGKERIEHFTEACSLMSELRNGSAHIDVKTRDDVMAVRKEIIDSLNKVISEIY